VTKEWSFLTEMKVAVMGNISIDGDGMFIAIPLYNTYSMCHLYLILSDEGVDLSHISQSL